MEYVTLYKLFFKEANHFESIYKNKLNNECSIKFNFNIHKYPAFYITTNEMILLVNEIQQYNTQITKMIYRDMPGIALRWLLNQTLIDEIKMTNDIEGVVSTRREIQAIVKNTNTSKGKRFYGLVNKYNKIMKEGDDFILSCQDIHDLYEEIMFTDIKNDNPKNIPDGRMFRKEGVDVYLNGKTIHQGILPENSIIEHMDKALTILNRTDIPLLIRVAIFHYLFGYIHPYYDGNGRMNRLITSYYLKQEMHVVCALQVSIGCKAQQSKYYDAFKFVNEIRNRGDLTPFILLFLEIYRDQLKKLKEILLEKSTQLYYYISSISDYKEKNNQLFKTLGYFIQAALFARDGLTLQELESIMKCSNPTVRNRIRTVMESDFKEALIVDTTCKPHVYHLDLDIFNDILSKA